MAERSNAAVLKTVVLYPWDRGFESLFLRRDKTNHPQKAGGFCFQKRLSQACLSEDSTENKIPGEAGFVLSLLGIP